ncbi:MAG TPA: xanthine dehydrogenase family protein molybdopterin-binding subunit [Acidimicrobiales bacterium]|nr:xanthine dehydrogenase family protein molybdopterin-binding subunit [Acidimicrobiales bacterium]
MSSTVSVLGHRAERREDRAFLRGEGRYVSDLEVPGMLHARFVRSNVAHGVLRGIEVSAALEAPGVVAVLTASDLALPDMPEWPREEGPPRDELARPCLAGDRVRFVGEAVAVVVAESEAAALDASELVEVDVEELPAVVDPLVAMEPGAPLLFPGYGSNVLLELGPDDEGALEGADVVVRARFTNQRVAPVPMEPNGILARPTEDGGIECVVSSQAPFGVRASLARALSREVETIFVRTVAVGGGFGAKGGAYPEHLVIAAVADRLGRPVRYVETRSENLVAMTHGRGQRQEVALGLRRDGTIVGLEATTVTELGAYAWRGSIPWRTARLMATGVYRIPRLTLTSLGVVTNTSPVGPYRGAGRPEAAAMLERLVEVASAELGIDGVELRRRNLLRPEEFPYRTPTGASYDSGDYEKVLDTALEEAGYEALRSEQASRRAVGGRLELGIGLAVFVEVSGTGPEYGGVRVEPDGTLVVTSGSSPHGQGHETTLTQLVTGLFGVPAEQVRVVHSDTRVVPRGIGTFGSRSGQLAGNAVFRSGETVLARARELAATMLEADVRDVVTDGKGGFIVAGVPSRPVSLAEVASAAEPGLLAEDGDFVQPEGTYPFGAHVAVVEVDIETGRATVKRLVAVDDCGRVINPTIVEGQVHGGLAQGIGQALYEAVGYDEAGNPLTTTLADYAMPAAPELPAFELYETETPSPRNPLGMKGVGEAGTVGAAAAVQNAVLDALSPYGVRHLDMPLTPERIWQALEGARRGAGA